MTILAIEFSSEQRSAAVIRRPNSQVKPANSERAKGTAPQSDPATQSAGDISTPILDSSGLDGTWEVIDSGKAKQMKPLGMIAGVLRQAGLERGDIGCIVVGLGPGSYTGIRAAIALAQGWRLARGVKLLGASSAEAIAMEAAAAGIRGVTNVVIDAQRGEFYVATWEIEPGKKRLMRPLRLASRDEVQHRANAGERIVGPQAPQWFSSAQALFPRAAAICRMAAEGTDLISGEEMEPIYLRETKFVKAPPPRVLPF